MRQAEKTVCFVTKDGRVLSNADITITQKTHDFLFGCGAFDALNSTGDVRMQEWLELFNYGTLPFYWGTFERNEGEPATDRLMNAASFLSGRGVRLKGHPLCWHSVCADWLLKYDNATIFDKQIERIHRDVSDFRGVIDMWDVINEVVIMPVYDRYDNAITRICKDMGRVRLVKEVFSAAKDANPDATLLINDFDLSESYRILIDGCLNAGVPISAIGIQTHQHQGYMGEKKLKDILERFCVFGLPLHFTENTLLSGDIMPSGIKDLNDYKAKDWPSTTEGEIRQNGELCEMYSMLFEHPLVEAVTWWDFADGAWLNAPGGLIRRDNTPKPSYFALKDLIFDKWMTRTKIRTDEGGRALVKGYHGDYSAECGEDIMEFHL